MNAQFTGNIQHTKETIYLLYKTQYCTYGQKRIILQLLIGAAMIIAAFAIKMNLALQGLLLLVGCWLLISKDFPSRLHAEDALEARKKGLPTLNYTFRKDGVEVEDGHKRKIPYQDFQYLVEDKDYLYLFLSNKSVCMVDKQTVAPGSAEELKTFVETHSGKKWRENWTLLSLTLMDVIRIFRGHKKT